MAKYRFYTHLGHDGPWLLPKTEAKYKERIEFIKTRKPEVERAARLCLIRRVAEPLPRAWEKAYSDWEKADVDREKADVDWEKADVDREKADVDWAKARADREKALADREKARADREKAYAEREKAGAEWEKTILFREGVAFHAEVCGCPWTPSHPDVLEGLAR